MKDPAPKIKELHDLIVGADGYIFVTPEYNHAWHIIGIKKNARSFL